MEDLLREYLPILIFLGLALVICCAAVGGSYLIARQNPNSEKLSPFECGFAPFDDAAASSTSASTWSLSFSSFSTSRSRSFFRGLWR